MNVKLRKTKKQKKDDSRFSNLFRLSGLDSGPQAPPGARMLRSFRSTDMRPDAHPADRKRLDFSEKRVRLYSNRKTFLI